MSQFFVIRWPKYWSFSFSISPSNEYWSIFIGYIQLEKGMASQYSCLIWPYVKFTLEPPGKERVLPPVETVDRLLYETLEGAVAWSVFNYRTWHG